MLVALHDVLKRAELFTGHARGASERERRQRRREDDRGC
jgi:hypothetical protein